MTRIPMIAFLAVSAAAATAHAQSPSVQASAAAVAEQTRTDDLSTINGQLVEVGEHNSYRYSYKTWNVSTNPVGLMLGFYGASLSYAVTDHVALRGDLNYYDPAGGGEGTGFEVGAGAPIYFRKMYSGMFLEPGVISRSMTSGDMTTTTVGPQVLLGYHWYWDSGFNTALAFGFGRNFSTDGTDEFAVNDEVFVNGYLRVGYAF